MSHSRSRHTGVTTTKRLHERRRKHAKLGGKRDMFELNERGAKAGRELHAALPTALRNPILKGPLYIAAFVFVAFIVSLTSLWQPFVILSRFLLGFANDRTGRLRSEGLSLALLRPLLLHVPLKGRLSGPLFRVLQLTNKLSLSINIS